MALPNFQKPKPRSITELLASQRATAAVLAPRVNDSPHLIPPISQPFGGKSLDDLTHESWIAARAPLRKLTTQTGFQPAAPVTKSVPSVPPPVPVSYTHLRAH